MFRDKNMKLLIFGIGNFYLNRKSYIEEYNKFNTIVGFVDNRADDVRLFDNKPVYLPVEIIGKEWDAIVIMSAHYLEMREQLLSLGISTDKIMCWEAYYARLLGDETEVFVSKVKKTGRLRILLIAIPVRYDGSSMAICHTAEELSFRGYDVTLLTPSCNESIKENLLQHGINVKINKSLKFLKREKYKQFIDYDIAIINVFPNIRIVCELCNYIPTLWWIHENGKQYGEVYDSTRAIFLDYDNARRFIKARVSAVSQWAADVFEKYYPNRIDSILPLGIPDESNHVYGSDVGKKCVFAVIGGIEDRKGQDIFLEAIESLPVDIREKSRFLIIGACYKNKYSTVIKDKATRLPEVSFTGELNRIALRKKFEKIDVVVCPSREETLSIAVIEGMMHSKICITTDATGIADYMLDGVNGFVVPSDDATNLSEKMRYVIQNINELDNMRQAAREVYDKIFSMKIFGDRLEIEINKTIQEYKKEC